MNDKEIWKKQNTKELTAVKGESNISNKQSYVHLEDNQDGESIKERAKERKKERKELQTQT